MFKIKLLIKGMILSLILNLIVAIYLFFALVVPSFKGVGITVKDVFSKELPKNKVDILTENLTRNSVKLQNKLSEKIDSLIQGK